MFTSDDQPGWSMDSKPIRHPSSAKKMKCSFLDYIHFWWSAWLVDGLKPHLPPLSSQKNEMLIFGLHSTSDDRPGWSMDLNPICHPSPAKKWNAHFLDYIQLLIISWAGWWTQTPSSTPLQPKKWNAQFWIMFNFWCWPGWLMDSNPICHPSPAKKWNAVFGLCLTSDDQPGWSMDLNPICHPSPAKKMKCSFWITFNFWWLARLVNGLESHLPPLTSQKMKCSFLDYIQLLMINWAGRWTQTPSTTTLQPKKWNAHFGLHSTSDNQPGWLVDSNPICHPSPAQKMKCLFLDYVQLLMIGRAGQWTQTPSATPLQPKKWKAHFWITFNFWCWPGWLMDSNPIWPPSPTKKMKCLFLDYVPLLMISWAGLWTQTPSATPLQPKKMKCSFLDYVHFWWSAWLVNGLKAHPSPLSSQKNEMLIFRLHSLLMISLAGQWTQTPSVTPLQPKKWKAHF